MSIDKIRVFGHGLRYEEAADLVIDRPYGIGLFVFLRFHSRMEVLTTNGCRFANPGQCILFGPSTPQWYRGCGATWINDWMHIEGKEVGPLMDHLNIPLNTLLTPTNSSFLPEIFEEISREQHYADIGSEEAVELQVRQLMLKLARAFQNPLTNLKPAEAQHLMALRNARSHMLESLTRRWTVRALADEVGLSPSRFAALYVRIFEVSPMEDLLQARLRHAQTLLFNRAMPINEAARLSGFNSLQYFSHVFHQRVGCAPRDFHRRGNGAS